jgi:hypothetical protein
MYEVILGVGVRGDSRFGKRWSQLDAGSCSQVKWHDGLVRRAH